MSAATDILEGSRRPAPVRHACQVRLYDNIEARVASSSITTKGGPKGRPGPCNAVAMARGTPLLPAAAPALRVSAARTGRSRARCFQRAPLSVGTTATASTAAQAGPQSCTRGLWALCGARGQRGRVRGQEVESHSGPRAHGGGAGDDGGDGRWWWCVRVCACVCVCVVVVVVVVVVCVCVCVCVCVGGGGGGGLTVPIPVRSRHHPDPPGACRRQRRGPIGRGPMTWRCATRHPSPAAQATARG
jgi:hypothetical protein